MAHRIATANQVAFCGSGEHTERQLFDTWQWMQQQVSNSTVVIADNVQQFADGSPREQWDHFKDFPGCVPFCNTLFIEWNGEDSGQVSQMGCLMLTEKVTASHIHGDTIGILDGVDTIVAMYFSMFCGGRLHVFMDEAVLRITSTYEQLPMFARSINDPLATPSIDELNSLSVVPMLSVSLANCKNVKRVDATDSEGPSAKWIRRQKAPTIRYHVLDINPMREVLRTEGGSETNGLKKALHICRGHFATYTADKPLFGNIVGTVWKPAHVRGDIKQGAVVKDYSVSPPVK